MILSQDWSKLAAQISDTALSISAAEKKAFDQLRDEVSDHGYSPLVPTDVFDRW